MLRQLAAKRPEARARPHSGKLGFRLPQKRDEGDVRPRR